MRKFLVIFFCLAAFYSCSLNTKQDKVEMQPSAQNDSIEAFVTDSSSFISKVNEKDSVLFKLFKSIPLQEIRNKYYYTSGFVERGKCWENRSDTGVLFSYNLIDTADINLIAFAVVYNPIRGWKRPDLNELCQLIVHYEINIGPYCIDSCKNDMPMTNFEPYNDSVYFWKDQFGTLFLLGFDRKDTLRMMKIGSYDEPWLTQTCESVCKSFDSSFHQFMTDTRKRDLEHRQRDIERRSSMKK